LGHDPLRQNPSKSPARSLRRDIEFSDLRQLLQGLGFEERIRGDHHIYTKDGIIEIINLQPKGSKAKPYQVKQVRALILKYKLAGEND